nr:MAG TPA: Receptor Binding Protein [Caudoviricetes sp.]
MLNADSFTATTNGDNTITVGKGVGCIHITEQWAAFPLNEGDVLLTFADADGVYPRWDVIALVYDKNANTAGLEVRTGLAAETPALPALRRNDDYDEIFLYRVTRPVGATKITADNVVDLRIDNAYCGLMRDTLDSVDTSVMQAGFASFLEKISAELDTLEQDKLPVMTDADLEEILSLV